MLYMNYPRYLERDGNETENGEIEAKKPDGQFTASETASREESKKHDLLQMVFSHVSERIE